MPYDKRQSLTFTKTTNKIIVFCILTCKSKRKMQDAAPEKQTILSHGKEIKDSNKVRKGRGKEVIAWEGREL
jgi:hypothetical protein